MIISCSHVMWGPFHYAISRPRVADRGDDTQMWTVNANVLNKPLRTADKRWSWQLGCRPMC